MFSYVKSWKSNNSRKIFKILQCYILQYGHFSNIRSFRFIKLYKKSDHFMFLLDQILVNSH